MLFYFLEILLLIYCYLLSFSFTGFIVLFSYFSFKLLLIYSLNLENEK